MQKNQTPFELAVDVSNAVKTFKKKPIGDFKKSQRNF